MSWDDILSDRGASCAIGSYKLLALGTADRFTYGAVRMQKVAVGESGSTSTWLSMDLLMSNRKFESSRVSPVWGTSEMREWLNTTALSIFPTALRQAIVPVTKYTRVYDRENNVFYNDVATLDSLWIPSVKEIFGELNTPGYPGYFEPLALHYAIYSDDGSRAKGCYGTSVNLAYWLRSAQNQDYYSCVSPGGSVTSGSSEQPKGIAFGFCL